MDFRPNLPWGELAPLLGGAAAGLHTMRDEHFGIGVVEYMAAGCVPIAHDSAGPREDIVVPEPAADGRGEQRAGYRCTTVEQYASAIVDVVAMGQVERLQVAAAARRASERFSDERFASEFLACMRPLLPSAAAPRRG